ncbi:MAG TPA: hypothetical protein PLV68_03910, partial [Ilumatobacteraceae bacterium]|nr:hypothetical protein [Ilumatobacteraceae bacterium]
ESAGALVAAGACVLSAGAADAAVPVAAGAAAVVGFVADVEEQPALGLHDAADFVEDVGEVGDESGEGVVSADFAVVVEAVLSLFEIGRRGDDGVDAVVGEWDVAGVSVDDHVKRRLPNL